LPCRIPSCDFYDLEALEEGHDLAERLTVVFDDLASGACFGLRDVADGLASASPTDRSDTEIGRLHFVDRLRLGGHDALERRVPRLDHTSGHRDERRQRARDFVVTGFGLTIGLERATIDRHLLGEGDRRKTENFGHLLGHGAGVTIARLGGGDHEIGSTQTLHRGGEHLGGGEGIGTLQRRIGHEHGLGRTHGERGTQTSGLGVRCHGHETHFSAARRVDQLQSHLNAISIGLVEDELAVALQRVGGRIERTGGGGVGDLLHTDDHFHVGILLACACVHTTGRGRCEQA